MIRRGLTLDNALNITPHTFINDAAGLWVGCTAALVRTPVPDGQDRQRAPEAEHNYQLRMMGRAGQTSPEQISAGEGPIAAALLLAPFEYSDAKGGFTAPTAILLPACDRDVVGLDGQLYYDRERAKSDAESMVISVLLQWANHNRFNTALEDEWLGRGSRACTVETLLPAEEQQQFLAHYLPRFFDVALGIRQDETSLLGLDASQSEPATLFGREVTMPEGSRDLSGYASLHLRAIVDPLSELNP